MNEKGCTKFEHTLRVCITVLSFWGLIWDAEYIVVDVERQRNSAPRMMLVFFPLHNTNRLWPVGSMGKKADEGKD